MKSPKPNLQLLGNSERIIATKNTAGFTPSKYCVKDNVKGSEKLNGAECGNKSMNPLGGVSPPKNNQNQALTNVDNSTYQKIRGRVFFQENKKTPPGCCLDHKKTRVGWRKVANWNLLQN